MKVLGLITEYNPFHNGHKYHIEEARKVTNADYVVVVMSGNFVQRGMPALINKYFRTKMALDNGADMVLELPTVYATASAEYFAYGSVALLNNLSIINSLCFGSEEGNINSLKQIANYISDNKDLNNLIFSYIKKGLSYPAAREKAINNSLSKSLISSPNNILAIEYIKALNSLHSKIEPITIKRQVANYHDEYISSNISSATAIRKVIEEASSQNDLAPIKETLPSNIYDILLKEYKTSYPISLEDFTSIIKYKLLSEDIDALSAYLDISKDMANRIKNNVDINQNINDLILDIKTKNITHTRITRSLIHILLNIKSEDLTSYMNNNPTPYARVLGIRKEATHLIRLIKANSNIPIITKLTRSNNDLDYLGYKMFSTDILATHLYNQMVYEKYGIKMGSEYMQKTIIV